MATIAGIATGDSNFSILVSALQYVDAEIPDANLVATLNDPDASLTVFAPTNAAFGQLAADLGFAGDTTDTTAVTNFLVGAVDAATLQSVITYHVAPGVLDAAAVTAADSITTVNGAAITPDVPVLADLEPDLINPSLTATDIAADNGIVHVIDRVLLPIDLPGNDAPSITQTVAASGDGFDANPGDFDMLLAAVTAADLAGALDDPDASLTVFAPTDGAFVGLAQALGYAGSDEAGAFGTIVDALTAFSGGDPIGLLTTVLTYHVAPDALQSSQITGLSSVPTLAGAPIMPMMTAGGLALGDLAPLPDPTVAQADIQASNGIIHAIDGVLLPADLLPQDSDGDPASLLLGTDGAETLLGGDGFDFVNAKGGDDIIRTGDEADVIVAGDGADTVDAGDGDDVIRGGATEADLRDVIYAGDGNDSVTSHGGNDALFGMDGDDTLDGGLGADRIVGGDGDDVTNGGGLGDLIFGNDGDDFMNGGFGSDRLNGGDGADTFFHLGIADHGSDWIQDFAEEDELLFGGAGLSRPATADDFVLHSNTTEGAGADDVAEAFVSFRPTGQILWALVDGAGVDEISLRIAATGETVDLIA